MDDTPLSLTEEINPSTADLDVLDTHELLHRINDEDRRAAWAVERELDVIGAAVDAIAQRLARGGRLHYFGAGTSGRIALGDAAEMPPTFSVAPDLVVAHIAGGPSALVRAVEGAEDDAQAGADEVAAAPYVLGAMRAAAAVRALTVGITNDANGPLARSVQIPIALLTGAEVVAGSTRMKAASAQKMALAAISTAVMVKLGRVHGNLMVDVAASNAKLRARALRITTLLSGKEEEEARAALTACDYRVKPAVLMLRRGVARDEATALLERSGGSLRRALEAM